MPAASTCRRLKHSPHSWPSKIPSLDYPTEVLREASKSLCLGIKLGFYILSFNLLILVFYQFISLDHDLWSIIILIDKKLIELDMYWCL